MTNQRKNEAKILAYRFGFKPAIVEKWMAANNLECSCDLMRRYPTSDHAEAMRLAQREVEDFAFS